MKKKGTTDAKRAAANDKENGNGKEPAKAAKPADDAKYTIGSTETVKRGFLKEFCDFTRKKERDQVCSRLGRGDSGCSGSIHGIRGRPAHLPHSSHRWRLGRC